MIRSEERLVVGTQQRESGRASAQIRGDRTRDADRVGAQRGSPRDARADHRRRRGCGDGRSAFTEEDYDVVLHAETPVVEKMVVPLERVRLDAVTVDGEERVSADLRKEHIEVDDTTSTAGRASANLANAPADESSPGKPKTTSGGLRKTPVKGKKGNRRRH